MVIFVFGIIGVKSMESKYNRDIQVLQSDIQKAQNDIDSLEMQKQELAASCFQKSTCISTCNFIYKPLSQHPNVVQLPFRAIEVPCRKGHGKWSARSFCVIWLVIFYCQGTFTQKFCFV